MLAQLTALGESRIVLWAARSWVQVHSAGDTVLCVAVGLWPPAAAAQSHPLPLEFLRALPLQLSHVAFQNCQSPAPGPAVTADRGVQGCAWDPGVLGGEYSHFSNWQGPIISSVCRTNPSWLAASPLPIFCSVWVRAQGFSSRAGQGSRSRRCQGQQCRGTGTSWHSSGTLHRYDSPYLIYAACIHIVKDHPGRPFCHWNSNAFSFQPSLCFWKLHAIFCDCVLPLCNPGNISQAFQWTMVLSRTVVLLLTLYC